jgi:hypothetical protein
MRRWGWLVAVVLGCASGDSTEDGSKVVVGAGGAGAGGGAGSGAGGGPQVCTPGQSVACVGPAGCQGGQACKADGSGYEPCDCGGAGAAGVAGGAGGPTAGTAGAGGEAGAGGQGICQPGEQVACDCPSGKTGKKTCHTADGGFGPCLGCDLPCTPKTSQEACAPGQCNPASDGCGSLVGCGTCDPWLKCEGVGVKTCEGSCKEAPPPDGLKPCKEHYPAPNEYPISIQCPKESGLGSGDTCTFYSSTPEADFFCCKPPLFGG